MKTQIIQLDALDDVASIRDQMSWGQSQRILLVWPNSRTTLHSKLDLLLLQRHARTIGTRLALVCRDQQVNTAADLIGLPVFRTIRLAQHMPWERAALPPPPPSRPGRPLAEIRRARSARIPTPPGNPALRKAAAAAAMLAFGTLLSIFIPRATITLEPQYRSQSLELTLTADSTLFTFNLGGQTPYRQTRQTLEGRQSLPTTGQAAIALEAARGTALFTNLTDTEITIPAGTRLRPTDPAAPAFLTLEELILGGAPGTQAEVSIEAASPGPTGNLPANSLAALEGDLGLSVSVTNPEPLAGGRAQSAPAAAPSDLEELYAQLLESLWDSALAETQAQFPGALVLTARPEDYSILEEAYSLAPGEPGQTLELLLRAEFAIAYIPAEVLQAFAQTVLDASLPPDYHPVPNSITISPLDIPTPLEEGVFVVPVRLTRNLQANIEPLAVARQVSGKSPAAATSQLSATLPLASPVEIHLSPTWWPWLPWLPIQLRINP